MGTTSMHPHAVVDLHGCSLRKQEHHKVKHLHTKSFKSSSAAGD